MLGPFQKLPSCVSCKSFSEDDCSTKLEALDTVQGFRVQGQGSRVGGSGLRVKGWGLGITVLVWRFRISCFGFGI